MEEEPDYDLISFCLEEDLYQNKNSSASSDAYTYSKQPSYVSVTRLTDFLLATPQNTFTNSDKSANLKAVSEPKYARNGESMVSPPPSAPHVASVAAANTTVAPPTSIFRSRSASGVSIGSADLDDSVIRLGRNFLALEPRSRFSFASVPSLTAEANNASIKLTSPVASAKSLFKIPAIAAAAQRAPQNLDWSSSAQQQPLERRAIAESDPQLPVVPLHSVALQRHRNSTPSTKSHMSSQQRNSNSRPGNAWRGADEARSNSRTPQVILSAATTAKALISPSKPIDTGATTTRARSQVAMFNNRSGEVGRAGGPKIRFYNIAHTTSPSGASLKGENVVPKAPIMRAANIQWDDENSNGSLPPALTYVNEPAKDVQVLEEHHVQIVIVKADTEEEQAEELPPPLDAHCTYTSTPLLRPLAPPPLSSSFESSRSAWYSSMSSSEQTDSHDSFTADEVVDVDYTSGGAVHKSLIIDSLRVHFLSGHNAMLTIANTPQCTALAEDAVSTMIQTVFRQSELMGSDFRNELSIIAHTLHPDGGVYNLLPTSTDPQEIAEIQIGAHPVMGTCIVNNAPVHMWSLGEATFLSRALIQNARRLRANPYVDPNALVHVTVLLRQTRTTVEPEIGFHLPTSSSRSTRGARSTNSVSAEMTAYDMNVYLSSLHILWVGHNHAAVHHLLSDRPANMWPLYQQAFGGQCCTAVMSFVDRKDDFVYSKITLEFSQYMRCFVNRPPRSGSVQKFLISTEQAANEEMDRNILTLEKMRRDAMKLLKDPSAKPCLYAVTPCNELNQQPYIVAYQVMVIPSKPSDPQEDDNSPHRSNHKLSPRRSTSSTYDRDPSTSVSFSVSEIRINMPSFLKRQEDTMQKESSGTPSPPQLASRTQLPDVMAAATGVESQTARIASASLQPQSSANLSTSTTLSTQSKDAHARNGRVRDLTLSRDLPSTFDLPEQEERQQPQQQKQGQLSNISHNDEPLSGTSHYGEYIKTNVLVVPGALASHGYKTSSPANAGTSSCLPLTIVHPHTLVLSAPTTKNGAKSSINGNEVYQFKVEEVREAAYDHSTKTYKLQHCFNSLQVLYNAFVREEANVALLYTHCSAEVRPFEQLPLWEVVESIMASVSDAQMHRPTPSQFTIFASILKGNTIVHDLAEVGSKAVDRPVDGGDALVGVSPLFGSILYQTRGVDLFDVSEVQPVLYSMLKYADDEAGTDPDVYLVMTAVRKTTRTLSLDEAPDHLPEYTWDASFSSFSVFITRNSMELFTDAVVSMTDAVKPNRTVFPFGLLHEVIGGSCRTVHFLAVETANTSPALVANALKTQQMLAQVQNESQRSSRISVYVSACLTASRTIYAALDKLKELIGRGDEVAKTITPEEESMARAHAAKLEALADQHTEYLRNADIRGFVIYPILTVEDMQTLFFTSFRYHTDSGGRLRQLQTLQANTTDTTALSSLSLLPRSTLIGEVATADPTGSVGISAKNASAMAQPVSAAALSRDSGIVAHTMLLLLRDSKKDSRPFCRLSTSPMNAVTINYGSTESVYTFDDVVKITVDDAATRVSPTSNYAALSASTVLRDAVAGYLAGYNATIVFQETIRAQEKGVGESLCQHVCRSSVASCPPEATFFISIGYVDEQRAVDLLNKKSVHAAVHNSGMEDCSTPLLGKSPFTGTFLANAELQLVRTSREVSECLTEAFRGDDAISAAGGPSHFLVISLWQKLYISGEQDVCLSSLLIILTRGGPRFLQTSLTCSSNNTIMQLLNDALRGPCYTVCGCGVTDSEPQAVMSTSPSGGDLERAMDFYQKYLNAYTGRALRYNSVRDMLEKHKDELTRALEKQHAYRQKMQKAGCTDNLSEQEQKVSGVTEFAVRHLQRMIDDEESLLKERMDALTRVPPFYIVGVKP